MTTMRVRAMLAASGLAVAVACAPAKAQQLRTWVGPVTGNWANNANWTPGTGFPNNSGPNTFDARIDAVGPAYAVTLDQAITVQSLDLVSANATLDLTNFPLICNANATISSGTLFGAGGTGSLEVAAALTLTNSMLVGVPDVRSMGTMVFNGLVGDIICDTGVDHSGTSVQWPGTGTILMEQGATFRQRAGSTFTASANSSMFFNNVGAQPTFTNEGVFRKTAGGGLTFIDGVQLNNTGTIQADSGTLRANTVTQVAGSTLTAGRWVATSGASLDLVGAAITTNAAEVVLRDPGSSFAAISGMAINAPTGKFTVENGRDFTTAGNFTNNGTVATGTGTRFEVAPGSTLTNYAPGTGTLTGGTLALAGTFKFDAANIRINKSDITLDGPGSDIVDDTDASGLLNFNTNDTGGAFSLLNGRNFNAGVTTFTNVGTLSTGSGTTFTATNDYTQGSGTATGSGTVRVLGDATLAGTTTAPLLDGGVTLQSQGQLFVTGTTGLSIDNAAKIDHTGTLAQWDGTGTISLGDSTAIQVAATSAFDITGNGTIAWNNVGTRPTIANAGTITKSAGAGTADIDGVTLDNTGEVRVESGSVQADQVQQVAGSTLTGGKWSVVAGSSLDFVGASITTNQGDITLEDPGSAFAAIDGLTTNDSAGKLTIAGGRDFTTTGNFTNDGTVAVKPGTTFRVDPGSTLTNFNAGTNTLSGGMIDLAGTPGQPGVFKFDGADIQKLNAGVSLDGQDSRIEDAAGTDALTDLDTIRAAGELTVKGARNFTTAADFVVEQNITQKGLLAIGDTTLFRVAPGSFLTNFNAGTGEISDGRFEILGTLQFDNAAIRIVSNTLTLDGPGSQILNGAGMDAFTALERISSAGVLTIRGGRDLSTAQSLSLQGRLIVGPGAGPNTSVVTIGGSVTHDPGAVLILNTGGILDVAGAYTQAAGGAMTLAGGELIVGGTLTLSGSLGGDGTINGGVVANGHIGPGDSEGRLAIEGSLEFRASAVLNIDIAGLIAGQQFDQLAITGPLVFDGGSAATLNVVVDPGFMPQFGQTFEVLRFAAISGQFASYVGLDIGNGLRFEPTITPTGLSLVVVPSPGVGASIFIGAWAITRRRRPRRA
ncbi:MAG: beta strand repeat-containing protein [Phycisphaerales bacterium]